MKQGLMDKEDFKREIINTCRIPFGQLLYYLADKAISKDEKIFGKYLKIEPFEKKEIGLKAEQYTYLLVTTRNFIIVFVCQEKCWYKVCPLNNFKTLNEDYLPSKIIDGMNIESFIADHFPGKTKVEIHFDVNDKDLKQITLETDKVPERKKIEDFILAFRDALYSLNKPK